MIRLNSRIVSFFSNSRVFDFLVIVIMGVIPFWAVGLRGIWNKTDLGFPLDPKSNLWSSMYVWSRFYTGFDQSTTSTIFQLPRSLFLAMLSYAGLSANLVERVYFLLLFIGLAGGMYYLFLEFFGDFRKTARVGAIIASLFYVYNPVVIMWLLGGDAPWLEFMAILPLSFLFVHKGIREAGKSLKSSVKYAILLSITTIILLPSLPPLALLSVILFLSYLGAWILRDVTRRHFGICLKRITFAGIVTGLSFLFNSWWISSFLSSLTTGGPVATTIASLKPGSAIIGGFIQTLASLNSYSAAETPVLSFRLVLFGLPSVGGLPRFVPSYWGDWIASSALAILGLVLIILSFLPLVFHLKDGRIVFLSAIQVISIGSLFGTSFIFGKFWVWLIYQSPIFGTLNNFILIGPIAAFSYSILIGLSIIILLKYISGSVLIRFRLTKTLRAILVVSICIIILLNALPMLTGNLSGLLTPMRVPHYYYNMNDWLNAQPGDFRTLMLPRTNWLELYTWNPNYDTVDIGVNLFSKSVIGNRPLFNLNTQTVQFTDAVENSIEGASIQSAAQLLSFLDVRYIIFSHDLLGNGAYSGPNDPYENQIRNTIVHSAGISFVQNFGALEVYQNSLVDNTDLIYATNNVALYNPTVSGFEPFVNYISDNAFQVPHVAIVNSSSVSGSTVLNDLKSLESANSSVPTVYWQGVNPTEYQVQVHSSSPFVLVFDESFAEGWNAITNGNEQVNIYHLMVNGYANGWYISTPGNFTITLRYAGQQYLVYGGIVSMLSVFSGLFALILLERRSYPSIFGKKKRQQSRI